MKTEFNPYAGMDCRTNTISGHTYCSTMPKIASAHDIVVQWLVVGTFFIAVYVCWRVYLRLKYGNWQ